MPFWPLICDGWSKNWKRGGKRKNIKLVDEKDYISKDFVKFISSGYPLKQILLNGRTTEENFKEENENFREEYEEILLDSALSDVESITHENITAFLVEKVHPFYQLNLIEAFIDTMILSELMNEECFKSYGSEEDRMILIEALRDKNKGSYFNLGKTYNAIKKVKSMLIKQSAIPVSDLVKEINKT